MKIESKNIKLKEKQNEYATIEKYHSKLLELVKRRQKDLRKSADFTSQLYKNMREIR